MRIKLHFVTPFAIFMAVAFCGCQVEGRSPLDYVDTRVGTAASIADITVTEVEEPMGYVSPIVGDPSAMTHWTPQTAVWTDRVITVPVPYWYENDRIQGFRGTRYPNGAVVGDWGAMSLMPLVGDVVIDPQERSSRFDHVSEVAKPHYYSVYLDDYQIAAECSAAAKCAMFQFTYPESDSASVVFDAVYTPGCYRVIPERNEIEGYSVIAGDFRNHFVAKFDKPFVDYGVDLLPEVLGKDLAPEGFEAEFYNNDKLEGAVVATAHYDYLDYDWMKAPVEGVVDDFYSARYCATVEVQYSGMHTFELTVDDGVRMFLDDELVIDKWFYRATETERYSVELDKGDKHKIRIEYFDGSGATEMKLRCQEPKMPLPNIEQTMALEGAAANAVYVSFGTARGEKVNVRVATSLISLEQARQNMDEEIGEMNFDQFVKRGADVWNRELGKIEVDGSEDDKAIFYTALTKCFVNPRNLNESGRYFSPFDFKVHEGGQMYTDLSLWDTFRSLHPLWVLLKPQESVDVINGMLNAYKEGGWLPKWPNPWYRSIMMGTHADAVIADAYVKGLRGFDEELAFEAMLKNGTTRGDRGFSGRVGIEFYNEIGYVPAADPAIAESVARTLEFAYDDYCIAQMAKALGKDSKCSEYLERSKRYENVLDKETHLVRGRRSDGTWLESMDKSISVWAQGSSHDTEVYYKNHTLLVPHDVEGLADFMGGADKLVEYLDEFFERDMYYVGDEFSMHAPYMYNFVDAPWRTQRVVRDMLAKYFFNDVGGLPGNDDCGQVSSWYVFGAMGFYPAVPSEPYYQLCSPIFDHVTLDVGNGKHFTIIANNNSKENAYIQSAKLNGKPYNKCYIHHDDVVAGSTLELELGAEPNKNWGL